MSVYKKLMEARIRLHGMKIAKSGRNAFANYNYMELSDFLIPAQQIFSELGLCGVVSFTADTASLTIIDTETDKQIVITSPMGSAALKGCHEVQNIGAVETYQRRYLWVAALEIVEHDAIDSSAGAEDKKKKIIHTPTQGAMDSLPEDQRMYLQELAMEAIAAVAAGTPRIAYERIEADKLDSEQKTALWSILDSKTRAAIKLAATIPL